MFTGLSFASLAILTFCPVSAAPVGGPNDLGQVLVITKLSPSCPDNGFHRIRYRGPLGGIIPPVGQLTLKESFFKVDQRWLGPGWTIERQSTINPDKFIPLYTVPSRAQGLK